MEQTLKEILTELREIRRMLAAQFPESVPAGQIPAFYGGVISVTHFETNERGELVCEPGIVSRLPPLMSGRA